MKRMNMVAKSKTGVNVQNFGRFLSGMVMPNIGAFIAWGLVTALFIQTGWIPNKDLATLVEPMIVNLLPLLIGYTGGKIVAGTRGGVIGAVATMGAIVGSSIPMFIGAMIMGPVGGLFIKKFDGFVEEKIPTGFEMLVNNFSAGIIGTLLALGAYLGIGPVVEGLSSALGLGVDIIINRGLLPITSLFIEPAKIFFLNNAINHGVLGPLGLEQAAKMGQSIFFLLETNPGPGLGILIAYWVFTKGMVKQSAPSAIIIHFFGGIHEIYFPYVLMKPVLLLALIVGGASGILIFNAFGAGLVATPSPGSIFALMAMAPKGGLFPVLLGIIISTAVSFLVAMPFLRKSGSIQQQEDLEKAKKEMIALKGNKSNGVKTNIKKIIVACDAGMGSSAMGASTLRSKLKEADLDIEVHNRSITEIPHDADVVITHKKLLNRAKEIAPQAQYITIDEFISTSVYDELIRELKKENEKTDVKEQKQEVAQILLKEHILLGLDSTSKEEAIKAAGRVLVEGGYVNETYIQAMIDRENKLTTYIGNGTAIPHGVGEAKKSIIKTGICILQYPQGIDFGKEKAYLIVGIAGVGDEHLMVLSNLAGILEDESLVEELWTTTDRNYIYKKFMNQ